VRNKRYCSCSYLQSALPLFLFFSRIPKTFSCTVKIPHSGRKFIINWTRRFHARIDKLPSSCRNLISAIFLSFSLSPLLSFLSLHFTTIKGRVAFWQQTFMKTRLTGSPLGFSIAPAFFARGSTASHQRPDATYVMRNFHTIPSAHKFLVLYAAAHRFAFHLGFAYV